MSRDVFSPGNRGLLAQFASSHLLLAFDFDGTLAPIVEEPDEARMRLRTRELLSRLSRLYPCAVISGRALADVRERVKGTGLLEVIGNHGLEPWRDAKVFAQKVGRWLPLLTRRLEKVKGVVVEDKTYSLAVHYRKSRRKAEARQAILEAAAHLGPVRVIGGHQVINLLPDGAPHKGIALAMVRERLGCDTALYVGDDETDEDVFSREEPGRLLGIRVGPKASSRADLFLRSQDDVDLLLGRLIALRSRGAVKKAAGVA